MRPADSLHNPFVNRFKDPVTSRHDEMQCDEYMAWLRERNLVGVARQEKSTNVAKQQAFLGPMFAGLCGLLVLLLSIAVFLRAL